MIYLQRLRLADAVPMALEASYFNYTLCRAILGADLESGSLYSFLQEQVGLQIRHASQELQAMVPTRAEADLLQITRRQPVLAIHQTTYVKSSDGDVPAIVGRTVYRADRYRFRLEVPR